MKRKSEHKTKYNNSIKMSNPRAHEHFVGAFDNGQTSVKETLWLYKIVFKTRLVSTLVTLLCLCFISQPFQKVHASEIVPTEPSAKSESIVVSELDPVTNEASETANANDSDTDTTSPDETTETVENESSAPDSNLNSDQIITAQTQSDSVTRASSSTDLVQDPPVAQAVAPQTNAVGMSATSSTSATSSSAEEADASSSENIQENSTATSSQAHNSETDSSIENTDSALNTSGSSTPDQTASEAETDAATTTEEFSSEDFVDSPGELISIVESDSHFSFSKDECTRIEDGSFYCQQMSDNAPARDALFAAPDADGDMEIYLTRGGETAQITANQVDDASPYYDEYSRTLVWHRLIEDRYQIISFDPETGEETQLTNTQVNNMEPTRHGDYIVWQRWVTNNWEIILYDGKTETQITNSSQHDIAPHVRGPLVIWNSRAGDGDQSLKTYDIENRTYTTIQDGDGVAVGNPRMVVMYEAMYENGDVIMKGFDLVSGEIIPLQSIPKQLPDQLPDSESTGETRALIQNKPSVRDTGVAEADNQNPVTTPPTPELDSTTIDLRVTSTATSSEMVIDEIDIATATIPTLVIPPIEPTPVALSSQSTSTQTASE